MAKILHIGGVDSPHVVGLMEQAKEAGFSQAILSYPAEIRPFDVELFKDVNQYYDKYQVFFTSGMVPRAIENNLSSLVRDIIKKEKPDIIHGHYLSKCAVPMYHAMVHSKKPGIVVPWSTWDIANKKGMMNPRIQRCLNMCAYVMCNNTKFLTTLLDHYKQPRRKALFSGPPVRIYLYKNFTPDTTEPRVHIPRSYYQDIIFKALVNVFKSFPNLKVTALSSGAIRQLTKELGIYSKINFLPEVMLSQFDFSEMVKRHNILFSIAPDGGTGGTMMQSAYAGLVTITNHAVWNEGLFKHNTHAIFCDAITVEDITTKLLYSINNLETLCQRFSANNKFIAQFDSAITGKNLIEAYKSLL